MMRVLLDTSVLLGALISPYGPPAVIYRSWRAGRFELVTSTIQLDEVRRVSRYPKLRSILPAHRVGTMVNNIQPAIVLGSLPPLAEGIEDESHDAFLMAMARAGEAGYLVVTGNSNAGSLQPGGSIGGTRIVTPAIFCTEAL